MKRLNQKTLVTVISLILTVALFTVIIPLTHAWLTSTPDPLENTFMEPLVPPVITEVFDGETKENVKIRNEGNVDVYIRVALVIQAKANDGSVLGYNPVIGTDYTLSSPGSGWFKEGDYYYFRQPVIPGGETGVLFSEIKALQVPLKTVEGTMYYLNVDVATQTIQALPAAAVEFGWPMVKVGAGSLLEPVGP